MPDASKLVTLDFDQIRGHVAFEDRGGKRFDIDPGNPKVLDTNGRHGAAVTFDSLELLLTPNLGPPSPDFTVMAWIKPVPAGWVVVSELGQAAVDVGWHNSLIEVETDGRVRMCISTGGLTCITPATGIADDKWHHVAVTYDAVSTAFRGYFDGVLGDSVNVAKNYPASLCYGIAPYDSTNRRTSALFTGGIDEFAAYRRALSATETAGAYSDLVFNGPHTLEVTAFDSANQQTSASVNFTIAGVANSSPSVTLIPNQTSAESDTVSLQVSASDPETDPLAYSATGLPPGLSIGSTSGLVSGTIAASSAGTYNASVTVEDTANLPVTVPFT